MAELWIEDCGLRIGEGGIRFLKTKGETNAPPPTLPQILRVHIWRGEQELRVERRPAEWFLGEHWSGIKVTFFAFRAERMGKEESRE